MPYIESPKRNPPKYDSNMMDFASYETCPSLHEEIKSLTLKLEQVSKNEMVFTMKSKDIKTSLKRPYKGYSYVNKNYNRNSHKHNIRCHYYERLGHTTPHCHFIIVEVPKGVMMWVPKNLDCIKSPKTQLRLGA
jgi:hypothetical protein